MLSYTTGEAVLVGDVIRCWTGKAGVADRWINGVVVQIVPAGTRLADTLLTQAEGAFVEQDWDGTKSLFFTEPVGNVLDQDFQFVRRGDR